MREPVNDGVTDNAGRFVFVEDWSREEELELDAAPLWQRLDRQFGIMAGIFAVLALLAFLALAFAPRPAAAQAPATLAVSFVMCVAVDSDDCVVIRIPMAMPDPEAFCGSDRPLTTAADFTIQYGSGAVMHPASLTCEVAA
jgi:hypothetical protein